VPPKVREVWLAPSETGICISTASSPTIARAGWKRATGARRTAAIPAATAARASKL
jgi:hypothetical protein